MVIKSSRIVPNFDRITYSLYGPIIKINKSSTNNIVLHTYKMLWNLSQEYEIGAMLKRHTFVFTYKVLWLLMFLCSLFGNFLAAFKII